MAASLAMSTTRAAVEGPPRCCVKNTFLELEEHHDVMAETPNRRSSSEPPMLLRKAAATAVAEDKKVPASPPAVTRRAIKAMSWFEQSELFGDVKDNESRSASPQSTADDGESNSTQSTQDDFEGASDHEERACLSLDDLVAPPTKAELAAQQERALWAPAIIICPVAGPPPGDLEGFKTIVGAAIPAMKRCKHVAQVSETQTGQSFDVTIVVEDGANSERILAVAKLAVLAEAEKSSDGIYVLGYEAEAFEATQSGYGFTASLVKVYDEDSACWDLLTTGWCCRHGSCRWQHPQWQVDVSVTLQWSSQS